MKTPRTTGITRRAALATLTAASVEIKHWQAVVSKAGLKLE